MHAFATDGAAAFPPIDPNVQGEIGPEDASRMRALQPGGPISMRFFSHRNIVRAPPPQHRMMDHQAMTVGSTLFVHAGILPEHLDKGLPAINTAVSAWIKNRCGDACVVAGHPCTGTGTARRTSRASCGRRAVRCGHERSRASGRRTVAATCCMRCWPGHTCSAWSWATPSSSSASTPPATYPHRAAATADPTQGAAVRIDVGLSRGCGDGAPQALCIDHDTRLSVLP